MIVINLWISEWSECHCSLSIWDLQAGSAPGVHRHRHSSTHQGSQGGLVQCRIIRQRHFRLRWDEKVLDGESCCDSVLPSRSIVYHLLDSLLLVWVSFLFCLYIQRCSIHELNVTQRKLARSQRPYFGGIQPLLRRPSESRVQPSRAFTRRRWQLFEKRISLKGVTPPPLSPAAAGVHSKRAAPREDAKQRPSTEGGKRH